MARLQTLLMSVLAIVSLGASSVSACTCPHHNHEHAEKKEKTASCHPHHESEPATSDETRWPGNCLGSDADCFCAENGSRIVAKSENIKLKKFTAAFLANVIVPDVAVTAVASSSLEGPYSSPVSDAHPDLTKTRGPPRA